MIAEFPRGKYWSTMIDHDTTGILLVDLLCPDPLQELTQGVVPIPYESMDSIIAIMIALRNGHLEGLIVRDLVEITNGPFKGCLGMVQNINHHQDGAVDIIILYLPDALREDKESIGQVRVIKNQDILELNKPRTILV